MDPHASSGPTHQLVMVSTAALREMVLATLEAYAIGPGKRRKKKYEGVEIYGQIWGHQRIRDDLIVYTVESISMSSTSVGDSGAVDPNVRALKLKHALMERWYPQLMLLGDFHSHPYENLAEVMQPDEDDPEGRGYEFSEDDFETFKEDKIIWKAANGRPLMLVMTICRLDPDTHSPETSVPRNVQCFTIGEYRFWLNASAGYPVWRKGKKKPKPMATPDKDSTLTMDLFPTADGSGRESLLKEANVR